MNNMIKRITFLIFGLAGLLGQGQAATGSASTSALSDSRDYTLTVDSGGRGNPSPAEGTHTYAWQATVTATVDATVTEGDTLHTSTGWTGTGAVPATGGSTCTGEITLSEPSSTIIWQWEAELIDTDNDGMGDSWENNYFGNLDRTGLADFDGDGRTNAQEFADGTDPTDSASTLGLLAYYPFDSDLAEVTGSYASASIIGTHSFVESENGQALYLSQYRNGTLPAIDFSAFDELTLSLWVREIQQFGPTDTDGHYHGTSYVQWGDQGTENSIRISHIQGNISVWPGVVTTYDPGWESVWKHYTATYSTNAVRLYIDGQLVSELPAAGFVSDLNASGLIGVHRANNAHYYDRIEAEFDELRVYGRALSSNEVETLYNETAPETFSVTFDLGSFGTRSGGGELSQSIQEGGAAAAPTVDANTGWAFVGWDISFDTITEDLTVTALYKQVFSLTVNSMGSGSVSVSPNQSYYDSGVDVTLTAAAEYGYQFSGWSGDASGSANPLTITMDTDKTITANFEVIPNLPPTANAGPDLSATDNSGDGSATVTLDGSASTDSDGSIDSYAWTWDDNGPKTASGVSPQASFPVGTTMVTLTITDDDGASDTDTVLVTIDAYVPPTYTLSLDTSGNGSITANPVQSTFVEGATVTLTATPDSGYLFTGWSGDASGSASPLTITMDQSRSITAHFELIVTQDISFDLGLHGTRTGGGELAQTVVEGDRPEAPIFTVASGFFFDGWTVFSDKVAGTVTYTAEYLPLAPVEGDFAEVFDFEDGREAYAEAFTIVGSNGHLADGGLGGSAGVRQVGSIYDSVTRNRPFALRENTVVTLELAFKTPSNRLSSSGGDMLNLGLASDPSTNWRAETGEQVYFDLNVSNTGSAIRLGQIRFPNRNGAVLRTAQGDVLQAELAFEEWYLLRFVLQLSDTSPMVGLEIASIGPDGTRAPERVTSIPLSSLAVALGSSGPYYVDTIASLLSDSTVYPVFNGGTPGQSSGAGGIDNLRIFIDHADAPDPNMLPIADAGIDFSRLDNDGDGFASLILDGSASVDLDGFISTAEWSWLDENETTQRVVGLAAMAALPVGTTDVSLTVTDNNGATATDTTKVTVFAPGDPDAFAGYLFKGGFNQMTRGRLDDLSDWVNLLGPDHVPSFGFVQDIEIASSIGKIFFASNVDNLLTVFRCNLDGSELEAIFTGTASGNAGLALDEANGKIYFAQASTIYETDLDGTNERAINTTIYSPRDFEFYDGQLYYHRVNVIERLDLTNETRQVLFSDGNSIVGLALDPIRERVFWSDQSDGTVMSMALDGSDQQTHFSDVRGARGVVPDPNSSLIYFTVNGNLFAGNFNGTGLVDIADPILFGGFGLEIIPDVSPSTYTLGLNTSGSGSVSANPNQTTFEPDSVVSLTAAPDGGHQFIGWSGDASGNANPLLVTMDGDKTITANFQVIPNAVPVAHAGPNQVVVDSDGNGSEAVTLDGSASSDSDGQIDRWDWTWSGGSATGSNPTFEFPVGTTDVTLTVTDNGGLTSSDSMLVTVEPAPLFFSVHFMLGTQGSWTGGGALTQVVQEGSTAVAPTFDVSAAWVFTGWDVSFENITGDLTVTAQYEAVTYSVIFDLGSFGTRSGGGALEQQVQHGEFAQAPTVLAQSGYAFTGWDSELGPILSERTIRAEYVSGYVLSVAGGSGAGRYDEGEVISVVAENPDSGFRFSHWSADPVEYADNFAETDSISTTFTMPAAAVSLTANYVEIPTYTITTSAGPNGSIAPENPTVIQGADQAFTVTPDVGYYIASLSVDGVSVPVATSLTLEDVQSAQTIEATFARSSYTVTFDINGGTYSGGGNLVQTVPHGGTASQPLVLAPAGFDFERWDQALGPITSARTITAIYSQRSSEWHTVVFDVGTQGSRTGGGELRQDVRHGGSAVAPTLEVNTGWSFVGWSASFTAVLDNLQLEAIYTRDPAYAQLTVVSDYGVPSITGTRMVPLGDSITVTMEEMSLESATERHNSTGWSASNGTSGRGFTASLTLSEDITLTWNWESEFYLDVVTNGTGAVNLAPGFHAADAVVNLTATPDTGSEFQGWSGAASGMEPSISLSMDEAKSVTASFGAHLVEASIDMLNPVRTVLDAPITFGGSAAASGGATIEQYRWRMIELVDNVETGVFIDLSDQATFIRSNLPAGHWRVYFDALDSTGAWANAATEELRIENPALLTDLALTRADLRFIGADGTALDPMIANQVRFGDALRVQISVHNLGGVDIDTPVAVSLYDGSGPADLGAYTNPDGLLGVAEIEMIPAGGLATATVEWQVGYDINGNVLPEYDGSFRLLTAVAEHAANQVEAVDGDNEALPIYEASPDNNRAQSTLLVGAVPLEDYQMAATLDDVTVREDQRAVLSGTARYLWLDNEDEVVGGLVQIVLDGRTYYGTTDSRGNFSVNADFLAPGSYSLTAEVSDGTLVASDTATLTVDPLAVPPAPRADLRVLEVLVAGGPGSYETESTMPHVLLNGAVNFAAEITNRGNLSVSAPFDVSFTVDGTDEVIGTVTVSDPLEVGASTTVYSPEPLWSSDTVGNYTIRATVDSGETVTEWSESNNSRTKVIAVHEARPDLRPFFISGVVVPTLSVSPAEPVQGETLTIGVDVYNAGPVDLPETSFVVRFLINGEVIGEEEVTAAINSEGHVHVEVPWDTSNEQAGFKDLAVIVDPEDVVLEDFENNNTAEATFELSLAQARLVIAQTPAEAYWYSQTAYVETGKTLDLDVVVKNIGGVAYEAGSFLRMSEDQLSNEVTEPIPQAIPGMGVDRSRSLRMTWTAPSEPTSLTVLLHVNGSVVSKPVVVYPPASPPEPPAPFADPAIRNTDISILGSDWTRGDQVRAGATIRNLGELDAENVLVQFFYSVDSVGYTPLGLSQTIAALPAGTSVDLESTGTLEAVEPYYNIRVRITSLEAGNRSFNDAATRSFAIEAPWADAGDDQVSVIGRSVMLDGSASQFETSYTWSFSSKPAGSEAQLAGADTVSPSFIPDLPGSYEIQLQVSDGALDSPFDWVNVLVNDKVATVLTVSSPYGTPSPAVGTHPVTIGNPLSISAADVVMGGVKRVSTGWSGTGIDPASGATSSATITIIDELPSLTWQWGTQYLFELATFGEGTVTGAIGWLPAGGQATLEAVPGEGYEFFKWEGDLAGSSQNGNTINLPVDQARSIEAYFRPVPVSDFGAQVTSLESVELSWGYTGLAEAQFRVERLLGGETVWEELATVSSLSYVDNTVSEGQSMFYRVIAVLDGLDSASADAQVEVPYLPSLPGGLGAEALSIAEVSIFWQPAARADGYVLQRRERPLGDWETQATLGPVTTWSDTAVDEGARYAYRVRAFNASGNSGFSATAEVVVPVDSGDWTYGLEVDNVSASSTVLCGAEVAAVLDVLLSNPAGDFTQHRVVAGLRDADGVLVGTPVELFELAGVPSYPPQWWSAIELPEGLRLPAKPGTYTLWLEDFLTDGDPREAFANTVRTVESEMAKRLAVYDAVLPEAGDAFVALGVSSALAGEFVDLPITVGAIGAENAFSFTIAYNPAMLEFDRLQPVGAMQGSYMDLNDAVPGEVGVFLLLPIVQSLEAGIQELATVRFRLKETATGSAAVSFTDTPISRMVADPIAQVLPHVWYDGEIAVIPIGYEGDVSPRNYPDGELTASDRAQIMRYALNKDQVLFGSEFQRADCAPIATRGDGKLNLLDALIANRYIDGLEPLKEAGGPTEPEPEAPAAAMAMSSSSDGAMRARGSGSGFVSLDATVGQRGEILDVPVQVNGSGDVAALSFSLSFDPNDLSFLGATPAPVAAAGLGLLNTQQAPSGLVAYALQLPEGTTLPAGEVVVLNLHFRVSKGASEVVTPLQFVQEPAELILADAAGHEIGSSALDAAIQLIGGGASGAPEMVANFRVGMEAGTRLRLTWSDVATETGYRLYRRSDVEDWSVLAELPANAVTYFDEGLLPGNRYAYRIGALNADGERVSDFAAIELPTPYRHWADLRIGSGLGAPDADEDRDGLDNYLEFLMGRDPLQADSAAVLRPAFEDPYGLGEQYMTLSFDLKPGVAADAVRVGTSTDLGSPLWVPAVVLEDVETDGGRRLKFRAPKTLSESPNLFMRIEAE